MSLKHADIWRAIDRLAEKNGLSPSGLAKKAGLSPTVFNPSKRLFGKRKRWPSTESIADILQATGATFDEFVTLAALEPTAHHLKLPLVGGAQAGDDGLFDDLGHATGPGWEEVTFPGVGDPHAFMFEVQGQNWDPIYREGDRLVVSPAEKPRRGDRVLVKTRNGEILIKLLGRDNVQKIELLSLNPLQPVLDLPLRDIEWMYRIVWASQ